MEMWKFTFQLSNLPGNGIKNSDLIVTGVQILEMYSERPLFIGFLCIYVSKVEVMNEALVTFVGFSSW